MLIPITGAFLESMMFRPLPMMAWVALIVAVPLLATYYLYGGLCATLLALGIIGAILLVIAPAGAEG